MIRTLCVITGRAILLLPITLSLVGVGVAQVMQSDSYQIESDSVNMGGGFSSSGNYQIEDTMGEIATGRSDSESFSVRAGYQQMQEVTISITPPGSVAMSPSISGLSGGTSNSSTSVTVTTDSPAGYELTIDAQNDPAMQANGGADTIADYAPASAADYSFTTDPTDAHLGYSIESVDAATRFIHDGVSACGTGSNNTAQTCWDGLSTTQAVISNRTESNHPNGTDTTIHFRLGVGGEVVQAPGVYTATTTVTAIPL